MSWSVLKQSFSQITSNKKLQKENLINKRNFSRKLIRQNENRCLLESAKNNSTQRIFTPDSKRIKLDVNQQSRSRHNVDSDEEVNYDPDYADTCTNCNTQSVRSSALVTYTSPSSSMRRQQFHVVKTPESSRQPGQTPWKSLTRSFREIQNDVSFLEQSITELESDDDLHGQHTDHDEDILNADVARISQVESIETPNNSQKVIESVPSSDENRELDFFIQEIKKDMKPERKIRCKKGGYAEKLVKALNRFESDFAFWQHERRSGLVMPGIQAEIKRIDQTFGRTFLMMTTAAGKEISICATENSKLGKQISVGSKVEVEVSSSFYVVNNKPIYLACNKIIKA